MLVSQHQKYQSLNVIPDNKTYHQGEKDKNVKTMKIGLKALGYQLITKQTYLTNN